MSAIQFKIFSPPEQLREYVECFRIANSDSNESMVIRVCPNGSPGIAFHHQSHFIRDMKEFAGLAPKSTLQKVDDFYHDQVGSSYLIFDGFLQFSHGKSAYNRHR